MTDVEALLRYLLGLREMEWLEFKENNADPIEIGEYVSALANSAALAEEKHGFVVWGVRDSDYQLVGTTFNPDTSKVGNEGLRNWLSRLLTPGVDFRFYCAGIDSNRVVILEIPRANTYPVTFKGTEYVRVGEHKKKLKYHPEIEKRLWQVPPGVRIDVASEDRGDPTKACFGWARSNKFTRRVNAPHGGRVFHKLSSGAVE